MFRRYLHFNSPTLSENHGQALVELALTLPLLLVILFGVVDLGRLFYAYTTITNASREGARLGVSYGWTTPANTRTAITNQVTQEASNLSGLTIVTQCAPYSDTPPYTYTAAYCSSASIQPGDRIQVTVSYNFEFVTLYLLGVKNLTLSNSTSMAIIKSN